MHWKVMLDLFHVLLLNKSNFIASYIADRPFWYSEQNHALHPSVLFPQSKPCVKNFRDIPPL